MQGLQVNGYAFVIHLMTSSMFIRQRRADNPSAVPVIFEFSPHSSTTTLRKHIENYHEQEYSDICSSNGWKNQLPKRAAVLAAQAAQAAGTTDPKLSSREPFSNEAFLHKIINWVVADDQVSDKNTNSCVNDFFFPIQSIRAIEVPELRQLFLLLHQELNDENIPKRDKLRDAILRAWKSYYCSLREKLKA